VLTLLPAAKSALTNWKAANAAEFYKNRQLDITSVIGVNKNKHVWQTVSGCFLWLPIF